MVGVPAQSIPYKDRKIGSKVLFEKERVIVSNQLSGSVIIFIVFYTQDKHYEPELNLKLHQKNQVIHNVESLEDTKRSRITPDYSYRLK